MANLHGPKTPFLQLHSVKKISLRGTGQHDDTGLEPWQRTLQMIGSIKAEALPGMAEERPSDAGQSSLELDVVRSFLLGG